MSTPTIKTADKIKLLDQMLEDLAGEEFEGEDDNTVASSAKIARYRDLQELDIVDIMH